MRWWLRNLRLAKRHPRAGRRRRRKRRRPSDRRPSHRNSSRPSPALENSGGAPKIKPTAYAVVGVPSSPFQRRAILGFRALVSRSWVVPVTYQIDTARKLIHTTCSAPLKFEQVIEHFRALKEDPACTGHLDVLLDVSTADTLPVSSQLGPISAALGAVRAKVQFGVCAIIAPRDAM